VIESRPYDERIQPTRNSQVWASATVRTSDREARCKRWTLGVAQPSAPGTRGLAACALARTAVHRELHPLLR
jgi:hypothetical protein